MPVEAQGFFGASGELPGFATDSPGAAAAGRRGGTRRGPTVVILAGLDIDHRGHRRTTRSLGRSRIPYVQPNPSGELYRSGAEGFPCPFDQAKLLLKIRRLLLWRFGLR